MDFSQHKLCTRKMELALGVKFCLDFRWAARPRWRTLANGSDVKYVVFPWYRAICCWSNQFIAAHITSREFQTYHCTAEATVAIVSIQNKKERKTWGWVRFVDNAFQHMRTWFRKHAVCTHLCTKSTPFPWKRSNPSAVALAFQERCAHRTQVLTRNWRTEKFGNAN